VLAAGAATPFIMTIDKAVTLAAAGQMSLGTAVMRGFADVVKRPHHVIASPALWMVAGVYGATYTAANLIDVVAERSAATPSQHSGAKLVVTTATNMSASIAKDVAFAKMFGKEVSAEVGKAAAGAVQAVKRSVPMATYGIFLTRDVFTIAAGFTVPPLVASALISSANMEAKRADKTAQLISPMGMQLICTPLHLLALNMYNEPEGTLRQRAAGVWRTCPESTMVRMVRFLFAYGFGGILNKELTGRGRAWTTEHFCSSLSSSSSLVGS